MSYGMNNNGKKIVSGILIGVLSLGVVAGAAGLAVKTKGFKDWSDFKKSETVAPVEDTGATRYEAENAAADNVVIISDSSASGGKAVTWDNSGEERTFAFSVNPQSDGIYKLKFYYRAPYSNVTFNVKTVESYSYEVGLGATYQSSGMSYTPLWGEVSTKVALRAGKQTITVSSNGITNDFFWDYIELEYAGEYEAPAATETT